MNAEAGRYEIEKGKDTDVCEAYELNLNSFKPRLPMEDERQINPEMRDFTKPQWSRLDPSAGVNSKIDEFLWSRDANPAYYVPIDEWRGTKQQYAQAKRGYAADRSRRFPIGRLTADLDIDNDGSQDTLYLDRTSGGTYGSLLLVLNDAKTDIDRAKTSLVMRHPSRAAQGRPELRPRVSDVDKIGQQRSEFTLVEDALHGAHYDVFRYKGKSYFDLWWSRHPDYNGQLSLNVGRLHVFMIENHRVREVCTYRFVFSH